MNLKPELTPLPLRMQHLPVDARGYPVPFFVAWIDGPDGHPYPEFRAMDRKKFVRCIKERLCWCCGQPLGRWLAFPIGPMCSITRTIAEPPSHRECAEWSMINCPFLNNPKQTRDYTNLPPQHEELPGVSIKRNPGVMCLWMTREYECFDDGKGGTLITIGKPEGGVTWWCEGRAATRAEVEASIESGLPILLSVAKTEGAFSVEALGKQVEQARGLLPAEVV
jgi:hypothetical protein